MQSEKVKQRAQAKKDTLDAVKQWKKHRSANKNGSGGGAVDDDDGFEQALNQAGSAGTKRKRNDADSKINHNKKARVGGNSEDRSGGDRGGRAGGDRGGRGGGGRGGGDRGGRGGRGGGPVNKRREKKDAKFGFGGKKRFAKSNTKASSSDMSGFSRARNNAGVGKRAHQGSKAKAPPTKRAGKDQRSKQRARK